MKVSIDIWKDVERDLKESGIVDADYDPDGFVRTITSKSGITYELNPEILTALVESGRVEAAIGKRL